MSTEYPCHFCGEPFQEGEEVGPSCILTTEGVRSGHVECSVRIVLGGFGHVTDHEKWCIGEGDPDAGLSYRESAKRVYAWLTEADKEQEP